MPSRQNKSRLLHYVCRKCHIIIHITCLAARLIQWNDYVKKRPKAEVQLNLVYAWNGTILYLLCFSRYNMKMTPLLRKYSK